MEEKIEVGEYVRTKNKGIKRIDRIDNNKTVNKYSCKGRNDLESDEYELIKTTEILNHSKNLIDLIEVEDYVNGHLVVEKNKEEVWEVEVESDYLIHHRLKEKDIKSIVTHEQFNAMKYKVGDD